MATFASDDFTDSDAVNLQDHTPTGGGAWTKAVGGAGTDVDIRSNGVAPSGNYACYYHTTAPAGVAYDVTATAKAAGSASYVISVTARQSSSAQTAYVLWPAAASWILYKCVAGAFTSLGTYSTTPATNDVYKLECKDATKKAFINSVERISSANNDITAAGYAGLMGYGTNTTVRADTWLAEQAGGGAFKAAWARGSNSILGSGAIR